jgi:hypothetical protein
MAMCFCCALLAVFIIGLLLFWFGVLWGFLAGKELSKGQRFSMVGGIIIMMAAVGVWLISALCNYLCQCIIG